MNEIQIIITILLLAISVMITRFLPFIIFKDTSSLPDIINYLGKVLPAAMMGLLVIYCFKDCDFLNMQEFLPLIISSVAVASLQLVKHNTILSISIGTMLYMVLIRLI